jgi:electron transfer flavoprotein alpha subunit
MSQDIYVVVEHIQGQVAPITFVMLAAGHALSAETGGEVVAVLLAHESQALAGNLGADKVLYCDHPALAEFTSDAYAKTVCAIVADRQPRIVMFGSTTIGSDVASTVSARLDLPLVSSCLQLGPDGKLTSKICGGKIMAELDLADPTTLVTLIPGGYRPEEGQSPTPPEIIQVAPPPLENLRVALTHYIQPEVGEVDITQEGVLVAVGRGIQNQDNVELAEELAVALGGEVCASRPVIDQGWLSTSRLVGKSGKTVKPKLYIALGISGAPEHVEGIVESGTVIAINTDPAAPIFDIANFGVEGDMFDLLDVLIERVEEAKGG